MSAFQVIAKPVGLACDLACEYCFARAPDPAWPARPMDDQTLERLVRQCLAASDSLAVDFAWQGGEPTLAGVDFFRRVVALQDRLADGRRITNSLQTNGVRLDDEWGVFLAERGFLVGISIDGPRDLHDRHRTDRAGSATFDRAMRGLAVLRRHGVEFNTLTAVTAANAERPRDVYRFLRDEGSVFHQYIPVVERRGDRVTEWSVSPEAWGRFLVGVFEEWRERDVGAVFVQEVEVAIETTRLRRTGFCVHAETCGRAVAMLPGGELYSCDHHVDPQHRLGNIAERSIGELLSDPRQISFGAAKRDGLPTSCLECEHLVSCRGGCPRLRFREDGRSWLCEGYRAFFDRVAPFAGEVAEAIRLRARERAPGRNAPCPCGSGRKHKHCCGR